MDGRTGEQAGGLVDEWIDGWMDGWMDEWTDISLILVLYCSVILQFEPWHEISNNLTF